MRAGMIKLITQAVTDVNTMPNLLTENKPTNAKHTSLRTPNSTITATVGITASAKNTRLITHANVTTGTSTSNKRKSKIY